MVKDIPPLALGVRSKRDRVPEDAKIHKRPLNHAAIAAPRTGSSTRKVVYVSASTSFIVAMKRVQKYLQHVEKRSAAPLSHGSLSRARDRMGDGQVLEALSRTGPGRDEEVFVQGSGRAIEKALQVGLFFQGQMGTKVVVRTGSVPAVDDVVMGDGEEETRVKWISFVEVGVSLR